MPLGSFFCSIGIGNQRAHLFLATELENSGTISREATEQITLEFMPLQEAVALAYGGVIEDSVSTIALILADKHVTS